MSHEHHGGARSRAEATLRATPGVLGAAPVRLRWVGRRLRAECSILVDPNSSVVEAHAVAVNAEHRLIHAIPSWPPPWCTPIRWTTPTTTRCWPTTRSVSPGGRPPCNPPGR
jgi:hypothetical protein